MGLGKPRRIKRRKGCERELSENILIMTDGEKTGKLKQALE